MTGVKEPTWLTFTQARMLHAETLTLFGGSHGIHDVGLLESVLGRPKNLFADSENSSIFKLAAAYGYGISKNHAFVDGNKRTALLSIRAFLFRNGFHFEPGQVETVTVMEGLATGELTEEQLAGWIESNSSRT